MFFMRFVLKFGSLKSYQAEKNGKGKCKHAQYYSTNQIIEKLV